MSAKYDVIVVGAGLGGTAAAKTAAEKKLKVLLLERGRRPGDKQMSGSYLFRTITEEVFPGFEQADFHKGQIRVAGIDFRWMLDNDEKRYGVSVAPGRGFFGLLFTSRHDSGAARNVGARSAVTSTVSPGRTPEASSTSTASIGNPSRWVTVIVWPPTATRYSVSEAALISRSLTRPAAGTATAAVSAPGSGSAARGVTTCTSIVSRSVIVVHVTF